jgi:hypothetical protein
MATAAEYAAWIVQNKDKRGTPQFETVAQAYEIAKQAENQQEQPPTPVVSRSIGESVVGAGEAALTMGTAATGGTLGMIGGTLKGLAEQLLSGEFGTPQAQRMVQKSAMEGAQSLTYSPRSEAGQEYAQQAAKVGELLAPAIPQLAAPGMVTQALRNATPLAGATAKVASQTAGKAVQSGIVQPAAQAAAKVRTMVGMEPSIESPSVQGARDVSIGAAATPDAIQRVATARGLPVEVQLTRGEATRDPVQLAFEKDQMKTELGGDLVNRVEESNLRLLQNFDALIDRSGAEAVGLESTGNAVIKALKEGHQAAKNKTRVAYKKARDSEEANALVDTATPVTIGEGDNAVTGTVVDYLNSKTPGLESTKVASDVRKIAVKMGVATEDESGNLVALPTTVGKMEDFRREISGLAKRDDAYGIRDETIIKKLIDAMTEPVSGDLFKRARVLRRQEARKYENRAVVARLIENRGKMADPKVAADAVFAKTVVGSSPEELRFLKRVMLTTGDKGQQAWKDLQGATINYIRAEATKGISTDSRGESMISPAKLHQAVQKLDNNGRLDIMLGTQNAQVIRDISEVSKYISTVPPNTLINTSGTTRTLLNAMAEMGITGVATGLPVPIIAIAKQIKLARQNARTRAKINDALNALPQTEE